ncbi:MAG: outer membrane beta-barrel protein [Syntrophobacterales bacterium]|nr:MAG: outer membrane beta-barrel protein [Syntrophobacterales bacterium]
MKRLFLTVVPFFLVIGFSAISWAEGSLPLQGSIGVGARLYGVFPIEDRFRGDDLAYKDEVGGEINITYRFLKYLALEGGVGYAELDVKNRALGVKWAIIRTIPISATLQFRWISKKPEELKWIVPYACIGGGYYLLDIEEEDQFRTLRLLSEGVGVDLKIEDTFFFLLGGGIDIFLTKHIALNFEARNAWAKVDIEERQSDGVTIRELGDTMDFNSTFVGVGFKYFY